MLYFRISHKIFIAVVCLMAFSCKQKEAEAITPQEEPIKTLIGIWSSPETSPYAKVMALYSDNTFLVITSSDVGGCNYHGTYIQDDTSIVLSPTGYDPASFIPVDLSKSERLHFHEEEGKIQWMKSDAEDRFRLYLCDGLDDIEEWYVFIVNTEDFRNKEKRYPNTRKGKRLDRLHINRGNQKMVNPWKGSVHELTE